MKSFIMQETSAKYGTHKLDMRYTNHVPSSTKPFNKSFKGHGSCRAYTTYHEENFISLFYFTCQLVPCLLKCKEKILNQNF